MLAMGRAAATSGDVARGTVRAASSILLGRAAAAPALTFRFNASQRRGIKTGLIGMPNVGKSTLFNALLGSGSIAAQVGNFPFCTIDPNVGKVAVPDSRLTALADMHESVSVVPTSFELVDVAGLIKGASEGQGLGNQFLATIRECDALIQVVRCFEDKEIHHVDGDVDPIRDVDTINLELVLSDLALVEKRIAKTKKSASPAEKETLQAVYDHLSDGQWVRTLKLVDRQKDAMKELQLQLLTTKPLIYAANVSEDDIAEGNTLVDRLKAMAEATDDSVLIVSAQTEFELSQLDNDGDRHDMLELLGASEAATGLAALTNAAYHQLGLLTFFTTGQSETRAWTVRRGSFAPDAAGQIHTDIKNGFIKAETIGFDALVEAGSYKAAKQGGLLRVEGKSYVVQEGDCFDFKFK